MVVLVVCGGVGEGFGGWRRGVKRAAAIVGLTLETEVLRWRWLWFLIDVDGGDFAAAVVDKG